MWWKLWTSGCHYRICGDDNPCENGGHCQEYDQEVTQSSKVIAPDIVINSNSTNIDGEPLQRTTRRRHHFIHKRQTTTVQTRCICPAGFDGFRCEIGTEDGANSGAASFHLHHHVLVLTYIAIRIVLTLLL